MRFNPESRSVVFFSRFLTVSEMSAAFYGPEPVNVEGPTIRGDAIVDSVLSCSEGEWRLPDPYAHLENGLKHYEFQWFRSKRNVKDGWETILSETGREYRVTNDDIGRKIRCLVRGMNDGGFDQSADTWSNSIGPISKP